MLPTAMNRDLCSLLSWSVEMYTLLVCDVVLHCKFCLVTWHMTGHNNALDFVQSAGSWVYPGYVSILRL